MNNSFNYRVGPFSLTGANCTIWWVWGQVGFPHFSSFLQPSFSLAG